MPLRITKEKLFLHCLTLCVVILCIYFTYAVIPRKIVNCKLRETL